MKVCDDPKPITITVAGCTLSEIKSFKYLGALFNLEASCARLIKALVWPIVTYGLKTWTLNKELCENVEAFEMQCYRRAMRMSYVEHVTNEKILQRVSSGFQA